MSILSKDGTFSKRIAKWIWVLFLLGLLALVLLFVAVSFSKLPDLTELENPKYELASLIYSDDNRELGRLYRYNRVYLNHEDISPEVINALIATEDIRFYNHSGIDARGTLRALAFLGKRGGASTITQQLAKQLFTGTVARNIVDRIWQKLKEWYISIQLEKRYTKEEILAMYLNKFDFIHGAVGLQAAAETYFGKDQSELKTEEAAVLVGMLKNPNWYNPTKETSRQRRNIVLSQMEKYDFLSKEERDSLQAMPVDISGFKREHHSEGPAPYFRQELTKWLKDLFADKKYRKPDGTAYDIYTDGIQVYTTIDYDMQKIAEEEMVKHMKQLQERYFSRWKNRDPWTYEADTDYKKKVRQDKLRSLIYSSDRYQSMRKRAMGDLLDKAMSTSDLKFRDIDIERMLAQEKDDKHLRKLIAKNYITKGMAKDYDTFMKSDLWPQVKEAWTTLQDDVDEVFDKPVKMTVFAYDDDWEKVVTMSPLDSIKYHFEHMQFGSLAVEPSTGHIKSWVGGINHKWFKYDHIKTDRQVGSTFKPFVYSAAITLKGMSPCFQIQDIPYTIAPGDGNFKLQDPWTPSNSDDEYTGEYFNMYEGLLKSKNTVSVYLMKELGNTKLVRDLCSEMGIDAYAVRSNGSTRVPDAPSICLGSADLSVMEMAGAYTTFANNGVYSEPIFVTRITDKNGRIIYKGVEKENTVFSPEKNYVLVDLLTKTGSNYGNMYQVKSPVGGKTGTTNDYVDGWFMGFTPEIVVATWVGGEAPWVRFTNIADGQGAVMAKPFFIEFMKRLEQDERFGIDTQRKFSKPEGDLGIETDCDLYTKYIETSDETDSDLLDDEDELDNLDFNE